MRRRGVSQVLVATLLILVTIALGAFVIGLYLQSLPPPESRQSQVSEQVSITFLSKDSSYTYIHFYNYGRASVQVSEVYVDGVKKENFVCQVYENGQYVTVSNVPPQSAGYVRIPLTEANYEIVLVTSNRNLIFYHIRR